MLSFAANTQEFDWQGHRGCRGLMPENTIPAFLHAIDLGVTTLEMDLVVSQDQNLIVSHEPWMSAQICLSPDGSEIDPTQEEDLKILKMTLDEISKFDCGQKIHKGFRNQKKMAVSKPTLGQVVMAVKTHCQQLELDIPAFNIEIKSRPDWYLSFTPEPEVFVRLVMNEIRAQEIEHLSTIQSFDPAVMEALNLVDDRKCRLAFLVYTKENVDAHLDMISFVPEIYSPYHKLAKKKAIRRAKELGMLVIPWTVNKKKRMKKLIRRGVDGIITDYPNLIAELRPAEE